MPHYLVGSRALISLLRRLGHKLIRVADVIDEVNGGFRRIFIPTGLPTFVSSKKLLVPHLG